MPKYTIWVKSEPTLFGCSSHCCAGRMVRVLPAGFWLITVRLPGRFFSIAFRANSWSYTPSGRDMGWIFMENPNILLLLPLLTWNFSFEHKLFLFFKGKPCSLWSRGSFWRRIIFCRLKWSNSSRLSHLSPIIKYKWLWRGRITFLLIVSITFFIIILRVRTILAAE